jgi:hypothetical protein
LVESKTVILELTQACVHEDLALFGHMVLGVLREVAQGNRLLDLRRQFGGEFVLKRLNFFGELGFDVLWHEAFFTVC